MPSRARSPGLGGAYYTTDLTLANTSGGDVTYILKFLGNQVDGMQGPENTFVLEKGKSVTFPDVLKSVFGIDEGFGAIQVALRVNTSLPPHSLAIQAQTSTPGDGGTFGQSVPAVAEGQFIDDLIPRSIVGVREDASFRTNLILANARETETEVDITLISRDGVVLASRRVVLQPLEMTQFTRAARELGVSTDIVGGRILLSTPTISGAFAAYAALIDNVTNDPRTLLPQ